MVVRVDIPIFIGGTVAYGFCDGDIQVPKVPCVGECLELSRPVLSYAGDIPNNPQLRVGSVLVSPGVDGAITIMLEGVVLNTREEADEFSRYMEMGFGLDVVKF